MLASNARQWLPAYAAIESPLTWTRETLDGVLLTGNEYYSLKQEDVQHDYLTADEVTGDIIVFGGCQVSLGIGDLSNAVQFDGYVNRARSADLPRLDYQIRQFLTRGCQFGILTIGLTWRF
ncbi:hypothetical protein Fcan01_14392 [Folsomia candida]|uniref:Uncharacterized protein n=1 Tax=Folsomia candida TaxID=158441 RepID=A0A226E177_FOLCA|nr:hypothetical protein Fcan01_14392 [Folsomia candida]